MSMEKKLEREFERGFVLGFQRALDMMENAMQLDGIGPATQRKVLAAIQRKHEEMRKGKADGY